MNDVVKERDERIAALAEQNDGIRADYEQLKNIIFEMTLQAVDKSYTTPKGKLIETSVRLERWTTLYEVLERAGLTRDFSLWYKAEKGEDK